MLGFGHAKAVVRLEERVATLEKLLQKHADAIAELEDKHGRLRGKVYAHKMHKPPEEEGDAPRSVDQMTRDELRRSLTQSGRFIPGRAVSHDK